MNTSPTAMALYKTAYSPLYKSYVSIKDVHQDEDGEWIIEATVGEMYGRVTVFRVSELTNFCL